MLCSTKPSGNPPRSSKGKRSAPCPPTAPMTRAAATPPSPQVRPLRSSRSAQTVGHGKRSPGRNRSKRNPASRPALRLGILETLDRKPRSKPDRSEIALPQNLRRTHRGKRPGSPNRRNPDPRRTDEPLLRPQNRRNHSRNLTTAGRGASCPTRELHNNVLA